MSQKIYSIIVEQNPELNEKLLEQAQGILSAFGDSWKHQQEAEFEAIRKSEDLYVRSIAPRLEKAGWWLSPSMPLTIWLQLKSLSKKTINERQIEKLFIGTFEENHWALLSETVNGWFDNKFFAQRSKIILDALDAHKLEKYTLSIP